MRVAGAWVGLGIGDVSEEVRRLKAHLRRKFGYAHALADTSLYDQQMVDVVVEMQTRYAAAGTLKPGTYTPGIVNAETKYVCGFLPRPVVDDRPLLLTVCGTGVPWWVGPDADTARALDDVYLWQPVGYPAQAIPMGRSIAAGRAELAVQAERHRNRIIGYGCALAGYSQGAIVISEAWNDIVTGTSALAWMRPHVRAAVTWGNPSREQGKAWPTAGGSPVKPTSSGVTARLLRDTPAWWRDYAHAGDLYTDVPDDESGENRRAIWQIIRNGSIARGPDSLLRQFLELGGIVRDGSQIAEATGAFKAMLDAVVFFGQQTRPHTSYTTTEAIAYLRSAA